jgi:DNA-binding MarR family transcriptional regulator
MDVTQPAPATPRWHFDSVAQAVYLSLWRTYDRLRALEDRLFGRFELSAQQYNVLRLLKASHPETVPTLTLASRLISRAPDITRMLDKLADRGLIVRERASDNRRVVRVGITPAGLELVQQIARPLFACHEEQLGHLTTTQLEGLLQLLAQARRPHEEPGSPWRDERSEAHGGSATTQ